MSALFAGSGFAAYLAGAIVSAAMALWIVGKGDAVRPDRSAAIAALALNANWCFAAATFEPGQAIVQLTEIARNFGWLFLLLRLFANDGRDESLRLVRPVVLSLAFVEGLQVLLLVLARDTQGIAGVPQLIFEISALLRMLMAMGGLVLLHNLYVGAAASSQQLLRWPAAALAGLYAFELNHFTLAYLVGSFPQELVVLRGFAAAIAAIPFALGFNRHAADLEFRPSRAATFQFLSLVVMGAYLALMLGLARWLDLLSGGDTARLIEVGLITAAGALALIWLPSDRLRGRLRVTAVKHLFKHRYDYRNEWIRFTNTIGRTGYDETGLEARCVKAMADITDSPAGLLLLPEDDGSLALCARWKWPGGEIPARAMSADLAYILEREGLIVDFDEVRSGVDYYGELALIPEWLRDDAAAWAAVPLQHFDRLVGVVVLARPVIARKLDWEDFDLLGVVGRQLASYLAEEAGQSALLEAGRFDEFNRRMAFVLHDIKNLSSQMSLLLRNAEKHADNPEFRRDMLVTLRNSADKLNGLLARLGRYGAQGPEKSAPFDLAALARTLADRFARIHPVILARAEGAVVVGEREALEQALAHIIQNAVDASPAGSPVSIEVFSDGLSGCIHVVDTGAGMSPQFVRGKLFKPFVSSKDGGFGIGAYEAREMIRAMGGRLDVESREGIGTRFIVGLPLQAAQDLGRGGPAKAEKETAL